MTGTHHLLATASVHVSAAACDSLLGQLSEGDRVTVLTVDEGSDDPAAARDREDAVNAATVRLAGTGATVGTERREGVADVVITALADELGVDGIVLGVNEGTPEASGLGTTAAAVVESATVPVLVVPVT